VVGAAILGRLLELGWFKRVPGGRALVLTPQGRSGLAEVFGIEFKEEGLNDNNAFKQRHMREFEPI
jgi:hypothetical protein